jgi:hypothetical protein
MQRVIADLFCSMLSCMHQVWAELLIDFVSFALSLTTWKWSSCTICSCQKEETSKTACLHSQFWKLWWLTRCFTSGIHRFFLFLFTCHLVCHKLQCSFLSLTMQIIVHVPYLKTWNLMFIYIFVQQKNLIMAYQLFLYFYDPL